MELFSLENLFTLAMLVLLQAVLGFDNLLYISLESKRVEPASQQKVRWAGIIIAVALRIVLLFVILRAIQYFQDVLFTVDYRDWIKAEINGHSLIVLFGGAFIIYTAMKEIMHKLAVYEPGAVHGGTRRSVVGAVIYIVVMNLVFSFDSILSAIAITDVFWIMATAIVLTGGLMLLLADRVAHFLSANRMYEVLGLFVLFIVGILLVSEGGHLAHLELFGYKVEPMAKSTFYFVLVVMLLVDIVQSRYRKKLMAQKKHEIDSGATTGTMEQRMD